MPLCHRDTDDRACSAKTIVSGQSTVFVNDLLWAVQDDKDTHCNAGDLIASYGPKNVFIGTKNVICNGDTAKSDFDGPGCIIEHPPGASRPSEGSPNTYIYAGSIAGGTVS